MTPHRSESWLAEQRAIADRLHAEDSKLTRDELMRRTLDAPANAWRKTVTSARSSWSVDDRMDGQAGRPRELANPCQATWSSTVALIAALKSRAKSRGQPFSEVLRNVLVGAEPTLARPPDAVQKNLIWVSTAELQDALKQRATAEGTNMSALMRAIVTGQASPLAAKIVAPSSDVRRDEWGNKVIEREESDDFMRG
jgi:hypothetical protein